MLLSGSLPMSSALTDSTTVSAFFFFAVELRSDARQPVMTMVFELALLSCALAAVSDGGAGCAAGWSAAVAAVSAPVTATLFSAASAGLPAMINASGLTAAAKRQHEDVLVICIP